MNRGLAVVKRGLSVALASALLVGCGTSQPGAAALESLLPTPLLLLGELHDAAEHQALQKDTVHLLARRGELAAVVLEMVELERTTASLPRNATEAEVRQALDWSAERNTGAWPWSVYGPVIMAAVKEGVPVLGGNLPRTKMRAAMGELALDAVLPSQLLQRQQEAIREGHCGLLPESQVAPMTRVQLARDRAMAQTAVAAIQAHRTVLLIAGNGHVQKDLGVPQHLPTGQAYRVVIALPQDVSSAADVTQADRIWLTPARPLKDHCAEMRQQMGR
jgi:uncharacterized iron-regulated protein